MNKKYNIGDKIGFMTIIDFHFLCEKKRKSMIKVKCDCGTVKIVNLSNLLNGHSNSCSSYCKMNSWIVKTGIVPEEKCKVKKGDKFELLTVIDKPFYNKFKKIYVPCKCECGNTKNIRQCNLIYRNTKSCGCLSSKMLKLGRGHSKGSYAKDGNKKCSKCQIIKSVDNYYKNKSNSDNFSSACKECLNTKNRKSRYNLSDDEYEKIINMSKNRCSICRKKFNNKRRSHIDHCHKTGKIRGLLCGLCNAGIGFLKEDENILLSAIKYIQDNKSDY